MQWKRATNVYANETLSLLAKYVSTYNYVCVLLTMKQKLPILHIDLKNMTQPVWTTMRLHLLCQGHGCNLGDIFGHIASCFNSPQ